MSNKKNTPKLRIENRLYLDYQTLCTIADEGIKWNYNRQLDSDAIRKIPKNGLYPISFVMEHHHRCFQPCEAHVRLMIELPRGVGFADVPMDFFNNLKSSMVVYRGEEPVLKALPVSGDNYRLYAMKSKQHVPQALKFLKKSNPNMTIVA